MLDSIVLGLVQGLTEFLPVSSSGHLIVIRKLLGLSLENTLSFDVLLHLATLLVIIIYFRKDLLRIFIDLKTEGLSRRSSILVWSVILGSIPAGFVGFIFGDKIEKMFRSPEMVAYSLVAGSLLFLLADNWHKILKSESGGLSVIKGFFIGVFQSLALISGFSRSGSTISGGLILGLSREEAVKFAFILGIPTIAGAALKTFLDIDSIQIFLKEFMNFPTLLGFLAAFFSGLWAIRFTVRWLSSKSFTPFVIYRLLLAIAILIWL